MTQQIFLLFFIGFFAYYSLIINKNIVKTYFIITGVVILWLYYQKKQEKEKRVSKSIDDFIDVIEKDVIHKQYQFQNVQIYKSPKTLRYIRKSKELKAILYRFNTYKVYNKHAIFDVFCLLEYFLKYHYYVMTGVYDLSYYTIIKDLKKEILNTAYSMYLNFRRYSTITLKNLDDYHLHTIYKLEAILSNYNRVLCNKYNIEDMDQDRLFDGHYDLV